MPQPPYRYNAGLFLADLITYELTPENSILFDEVEPADAGKIDRVTASFRNELARYTYKPNVTITVEPPRMPNGDAVRYAFLGPHDHLPTVRIAMKVPDSRNAVPVKPTRFQQVNGRPEVVTEHPTIEVKLKRVIPEDLTWPEYPCEERSERFAWFLRTALEEVELHEMREWWRRDGELVDDPHAKAAPSAVGPIR